MPIFKILFLGSFIYILVGCGGGPTPRLLDLVEKEARPSRELHSDEIEWSRASKIGLMVHSDSTAAYAAPVMIPDYLQMLARRTENFLNQRCSFLKILTVPPSFKPGHFSQELQVQGQRLQVPYVMVVVFSSREKTGPEKLGEATMMTQMSGTVIENSAMAEVGVFRVSDFNMVFLTSGQATETLEQLDVPIGRNRPLAKDSRDILRARAGQYALDRALEPVGSACQRGQQG